MSSQLHHYTFCPFCMTSVKNEVQEEFDLDEGVGKLRRHVTVTCPECEATIKFRLHWQVASAEVVFAGRATPPATAAPAGEPVRGQPSETAAGRD
jgi:hypothetical protein